MRRNKDSYRSVAQIMKGVANHFRVEILALLHNFPNRTLWEITESLDCNFRTISEHTRKMAQAGLVIKQYRGVSVHHRLTRLGERVLKFLSTLETD